MQRFRNLLVGVDIVQEERGAVIPPATQEAIECALWLAGRISARVTFLNVLELRGADSLSEEERRGVTTSVGRAAEEVLAQLVARAGEKGVEAEALVTCGNDSLEILRQIVRGGHDLVVVGTRHRSGPVRLLFGSTTTRLLRKSPCPVWITKPGPRREIINVLVANDLSEVGEDALHIAIAAGQLTDMKIHLVHAVDYSLARSLRTSGMGEAQIDAYRLRTRQAAEQALQLQLSRTDFRTLTYGVQVHVLEGMAEVVIPQFAEEHDIDLVIMGTIARSGIPGLLLGNTAERLLPEIPCSLLAIKPQGFQSPVPLE